MVFPSHQLSVRCLLAIAVGGTILTGPIARVHKVQILPVAFICEQVMDKLTAISTVKEAAGRHLPGVLKTTRTAGR